MQKIRRVWRQLDTFTQIWFAVCLLICAISVYGIYRSNQQIKFSMFSLGCQSQSGVTVETCRKYAQHYIDGTLEQELEKLKQQ